MGKRRWEKTRGGILLPGSHPRVRAAYARRYRANASPEWHMAEKIRQLAWRRALSKLRELHKEEFKRLMEEEKRTIREELRAAGE